MESIRLRARSKINLSIDIKGILDDGYHDVEMVMQSIDLSDYIIIRKTKSSFKLVCSNSEVPTDKRNIIYKTWKLMKDTYNIGGGIEVFLEKNIPMAAGMAGGSADSAAVFVGINELFKLGVSQEDLMDLSKELGSDIAFCFGGGTALAYGRGTDLKVLDTLKEDFSLLVCKPRDFVSTKRVYKMYDAMYLDREPERRPDNRSIEKGLANNDIDMVIGSMSNVLEGLTRSFCHDVRNIEKIMMSKGADLSMMTGSGPAVFGIFKDKNKAKKCASILREGYVQTYVTSISNKGVEICGNK